MIDSKRLSIAVPCLLCRRSTKNASHMCSNHRKVSVGDRLYLDKSTVLSSNNLLTGSWMKSHGVSVRAEQEERNVEMMKLAPYVESDQGEVVHNAFALGSTVKGGDGQAILTDTHEMQATEYGYLIRQGDVLIVEASDKGVAKAEAERLRSSLWAQTLDTYNVECESYQDIAQAVSQVGAISDADYRATRDGKLKVVYADESGNRHGYLFDRDGEYVELTEEMSGVPLSRVSDAELSRVSDSLDDIASMVCRFDAVALRNSDGTVRVPVGWDSTSRD